MKQFVAFISTIILTLIVCIYAYETWGFIAALVIFLVCIILGAVVMGKITDADVSKLKEEGDINKLYDRAKAGDMYSSDYARGLGKIDDPRAFEMLLKLFHDDDFIVRANAAEGLGLTGNLQAVEPLIKSLKDYNKGLNVVLSAVSSLGKLGDPRAIGPLTKVLHNKYLIYTHASVIKVLGEFGHPVSGFRILINLYKRPYDHSDNRIATTKNQINLAIHEALKMFDSPLTIQPLITALKDKDVR